MDFSNKFDGFVGVVITTIIACGLVGCGHSSSSSTPTPASTSTSAGQGNSSYTGAGSKWDVDLNEDATFLIQRRDEVSSGVDLTVSGDYETLASGFLLLTVVEASGADAPQSGDTAWALELPGYALMLNTDGRTDSQLIAMVESGSCPADDFVGNWVVVKSREGALATDSDQDFFGTFDFDLNNSSAMLPQSLCVSR